MSASHGIGIVVRVNKQSLIPSEYQDYVSVASLSFKYWNYTRKQSNIDIEMILHGHLFSATKELYMQDGS